MYIQPANTNQGPLPADYKPTSMDILCGRGKSFSRHSGNKKFSEIIRSNLQTYTEAPKRVDKSIVVDSVVQIIQDKGLRFLKRDKKSGSYFELNEDQAHEKTGHAIRDLLKIAKQANNKKSTFSALQQSKRIKKQADIKFIDSIAGSFCFDSDFVAPNLLVSAALKVSDELCLENNILPDLPTSEALVNLFDVEEDLKGFDDMPLDLNDENAQQIPPKFLDNFDFQPDFVPSVHTADAPLPLAAEMTMEKTDIMAVFSILAEA